MFLDGVQVGYIGADFMSDMCSNCYMVGMSSTAAGEERNDNNLYGFRLDLIKDKVNKSPNGYVLDGWPRYMQQVRDMEQSGIGYDFAVFLDVSREEVLKRLLARGRADDTEEIINNRIDLYKRETGPVVEYFRGKTGFIEINAEGDTPENTANWIIKRREDESK